MHVLAPAQPGSSHAATIEVVGKGAFDDPERSTKSSAQLEGLPGDLGQEPRPVVGDRAPRCLVAVPAREALRLRDHRFGRLPRYRPECSRYRRVRATRRRTGRADHRPDACLRLAAGIDHLVANHVPRHLTDRPKWVSGFPSVTGCGAPSATGPKTRSTNVRCATTVSSTPVWYGNDGKNTSTVRGIGNTPCGTY